MSHFGVLSYQGAGHLNPMIALSRQLVARGHRVTLIHTADVEAQALRSGLEFCSLGPHAPYARSQDTKKHKWPLLRDVVALWDGVARIARDMEFFLQEAPKALTTTGVDVLLMDEISLAGPTLAEMFHLPYFILSTSVPHNFGWSGSAGIDAEKTVLDRLRSAILEVSNLRMRGPVRLRLNKLRSSLGLNPMRRSPHPYPELAHITQLPHCLDVPLSTIPLGFHYAGPLIDETARPSTPFQWNRLDGRRMVYASLGTSRHTDLELLRFIAEACCELRLQLVISLGGRRDPDSLPELLGDPIVVKDLPQLEILKRADIVITHGGLNTALETLINGKPMIVIPRRFDQPAVAARLEWHGVALVLAAKSCSSLKIRNALSTILTEPSYRENAVKMQGAVRSSYGLARAVDIIDGVSRRFAESKLMSRAASDLTAAPWPRFRKYSPIAK